MPKYAVIVVSHGNKLTDEGERFWVTYDSTDHWISSKRYREGDKVPGDIHTFDTPDEAAAFAEKWGGHPWWCQPNGDYEIIPVKPHMVTIQRGWDRDA